MKKSIDFEAKLFLLILNLSEEKNKSYSILDDVNNRKVYLFDNYNEFRAYFSKNGLVDVKNDLIDLSRMKTTTKGTVIASKNLCDYTIRKYRESKLTDEQMAMVKEWEAYECCAPKDKLGFSFNGGRCSNFVDCHDCLVDFAYLCDEVNKVDTELVNVSKNSSKTLKKISK